MSDKREFHGLRIYSEYLPNSKSICFVITFVRKLSEISFGKTSLLLNQTLTINFANFSIDPSAVLNFKSNCNETETYYETSVRFNVLHLDVDTLCSKNDNKSNVLFDLKCGLCSENLLMENERFPLYEIPNDELNELDDNFWCHNHDHDHGDHLPHGQPFIDLNEYRAKSVLHNMTLITLSPSKIKQEKIVNVQNDHVSCSNCTYSIGYLKGSLNLWKTNVTFNNNKPADFQSLLFHMEQGRYVFNVRKMPNKKLYIWIIVDDLYFAQCNRPGPTMSLSLAKKCKKLLYNYTDHEDTESPKFVAFKKCVGEWKNDINVEYIEISFEFYLVLFRTLVDSTESLYKSLKTTKNGFYVAVV